MTKITSTLFGSVISSSSFALAAYAIGFAIIGRQQHPLRKLVASAEASISSIVLRIDVQRASILSLGLLVAFYAGHLWLIASEARAPATGLQHLARFCLDVLYSLILFALYFLLRDAKYTTGMRAAIIVCAVFLYGTAILMTDGSSADIYAYIAYAKLGWAAYAPPDTAFSGSFAVLNPTIATAWKHLEPAPYGPLFLIVDRLIAGPASTFAQARIELRLLDVAAIATTVVALRRMGFGTALLVIFSLDPEIVINYVVDGHNDILCIALILGGMALFQRNRLLAIALAACAGAIKAPYLFPALLVAFPAKSRMERVSVAAAIALGTALLSFVHGADYVRALTWHGNANALGRPVVQELLHISAVATALLAVGLAIGFKRIIWPATLLFPQFFAAGYQWYVISGVPYALLDRRGWTFLALLPVWMYAFRILNSHL